MNSQEIKKVELGNIESEDNTVSVTVISNGREETFHVQTVDNEYRPDLGCWILTDYAEGDIDIDDYPEFDVQEIIKKAENFMQSKVKVEPTDYKIEGDQVYLKIYPRPIMKVEVVTKNSNFINKVHSTHEREFSDPIETFVDREDAIDYLENL